jgi:hypothetical protein
MSADAESTTELEQVKRGKPRRFAMIVKGEQILNLVVYKKGSLQKYKKEAKEDGAGQFYHGVIDGKGENIVFKLSMVDGFTAPPGTEAKLKAHLKQELGMKFKPTYQIVTELPDVAETDDDEDPEVAAAQPATGQPITDPAEAAKLSEALNKLTPLVKQAVAATPERKAEILKPTAAIKKLIAEQNLARAKKQLLAYASVLKKIIAAGAPAKADIDLMAVWQAAKESVDRQLEQFRIALAKTGDPYLTKIATGGVETLVVGPGKEYVKLQVALFDLKSADAARRKQAGQTVLAVVKSYQKFVASSQFIKICDTNKLCGPMTVAKTLADALDTLEKSIGATAA